LRRPSISRIKAAILLPIGKVRYTVREFCSKCGTLHNTSQIKRLSVALRVEHYALAGLHPALKVYHSAAGDSRFITLSFSCIKFVCSLQACPACRGASLESCQSSRKITLQSTGWPEVCAPGFSKTGSETKRNDPGSRHSRHADLHPPGCKGRCMNYYGGVLSQQSGYRLIPLQ